MVCVLCVCMCVQVCVCAPVCVCTGVYIKGGQRRMPGVLLHHFPFLPWDRISHWTGSLLFFSARLPGQLVALILPPISISLHPQCWDYRYGKPCTDLSHRWWGSGLTPSCLHSKCSYLPSHLLSLESLTFYTFAIETFKGNVPWWSHVPNLAKDPLTQEKLWGTPMPNDANLFTKY